MKINGDHISLFAGVGMADLATEAFGFTTVATAEQDEFCRSVLAARFPRAVHFKDVRNVSLTDLGLVQYAPGIRSQPLIVSGGFPCQDVSLSGLGAGIDGKRSGLWGEFARIIEEFHPDYVLIENVAALRGRGLDRVLSDLAGLSYSARWDCIPAAAVGAPHMRDRIFILATRKGTPKQASTVKPLGFIDTLTGKGPGGDFVPTIDRMPRAGSMVYGLVSEDDPIATQAQAKASMRKGEMLLPSPAKSEPGWRGIVVRDRRGLPPAHPNQRFYDRDTGRVVQKGVAQIATMFPNLKPASHVLIPTPTRREGMSGPGRSPKRKGGVNLRTFVNEQDGDYKLNPDWVEWMMGLPAGWTNPDVVNADLRPFEGWQDERIPRTWGGAPYRRKRLEACGNGLVPQAAMVALDWMVG